MDELEMEEALSNVDDIVAHYQQIASNDYDEDEGDGPDPDAESEALTEWTCNFLILTKFSSILIFPQNSENF